MTKRKFRTIIKTRVVAEAFKEPSNLADLSQNKIFNHSKSVPGGENFFKELL